MKRQMHGVTIKNQVIWFSRQVILNRPLLAMRRTPVKPDRHAPGTDARDRWPCHGTALGDDAMDDVHVACVGRPPFQLCTI